jgi:DNA topoisomerase-1
VNQGKVNATLPKTVQPADVTLEQALELIAERAAKSGGRKPTRKAAAKAPAKKAPAKKAAAKKPAVKKAPAKKAGAKAAAKKTKAEESV